MRIIVLLSIDSRLSTDESCKLTLQDTWAQYVRHGLQHI